jgi:hypothetical protein
MEGCSQEEKLEENKRGEKKCSFIFGTLRSWRESQVGKLSYKTATLS